MSLDRDVLVAVRGHIELLPRENVRLVPEAHWFSVLAQSENKANAVLAMYCWKDAAELLKAMLAHGPEILDRLIAAEDTVARVRGLVPPNPFHNDITIMGHKLLAALDPDTKEGD
jgi:hypothetical protein